MLLLCLVYTNRSRLKGELSMYLILQGPFITCAFTFQTLYCEHTINIG